MIENVRQEAVEEEEEGEHGAKQSWFSLIQKVFLSPSISQEKKYRKNYELFSWISRIQKDLAVVSFDKYAHSSSLCC